MLFVIVCSVINLAYSYAHPPEDMVLRYDRAKKLLKVAVKHMASNPKNHYIEKIRIKHNWEKIFVKEYKKQESYPEQTLMYRIPQANIGDTLQVEAWCNKYGNLKRKIKIPEKGLW